MTLVAANLDPSVKPVRLRKLLSIARRAPVTGGLAAVEVTPAEALFVWLAGAMAAKPLMSQEYQDTLLTLLADRLLDVGERIAKNYAARPYSGYVVVSDGTFAVVSGMTEMLDLRSGDFVPCVPSPPILTGAYNLGPLYAFHMERLAKDGETCKTSA